MLDKLVTVTEDTFKDEMKGDILFLNIAELKKEYKYIGIWYARDRTEDSSITTELYYGGDKRPDEFSEEIKENSFKQAGRYMAPLSKDSIWVATRTDNSTYCRMKLFDFQKEQSYINYKLIRNKAGGIEVHGTGVIRGGEAHFAKVGIEDLAGEIDYADTILYLVLLKELPPEDWKIDHKSYGIQRLPVFVPTVRFSIEEKYTPWFDQNPLENR